MDRKTNTSRFLAAGITRASSKQTFYTIRFLVDRELVLDAYRAYAYFRWVDDILDAGTGSQIEKIAFLERQQSLLEACYRLQAPGDLNEHEQLLADLIANDGEDHSGLRSYLRNMMAVMAFDVERRGRLISQDELLEYSRLLATAVTEALHYFIGHNCPPPCNEKRYLAVQGAHVVHMLRDALEDTGAGYFNIPAEYLQAQGISVQNTDQRAYRDWVRARVKLARSYFNAGRDYLAQVKNLRCRLAGFAYMARFEWVLQAIEQDNYRLRAAYPERKNLPAGLWMAWRMLASVFGLHRFKIQPRALAIQSAQYEER
jgi:phytoene/squalene synthetase